LGPRVFTTNFWGTEKGEIKKTIILNWRRPTQKCHFLKLFFLSLWNCRRCVTYAIEGLKQEDQIVSVQITITLKIFHLYQYFISNLCKKWCFYVSIKICWYETSLFDVWFYAAINEIEIANFNYCKEPTADPNYIPHSPCTHSLIWWPIKSNT
jgi:hypothetical protein